jgi:hypothetical protein
VQSRIVTSVLATSLTVFIVLPTAADAAGMTNSVRPTTTLVHEHGELLRRLTLVGPAVAISVLTILGLTIGFPALRRDMRHRRGVYRRRRRRDSN